MINIFPSAVWRPFSLRSTPTWTNACRQHSKFFISTIACIRPSLGFCMSTITMIHRTISPSVSTRFVPFLSCSARANWWTRCVICSPRISPRPPRWTAWRFPKSMNYSTKYSPCPMHYKRSRIKPTDPTMLNWSFLMSRLHRFIWTNFSIRWSTTTAHRIVCNG